MNTRKLHSALLAAGLNSALLATGLMAIAPAHAADATVTIKNFDFMQMNLAIAAGDTVTWKNLDGEPHTVASLDGAFRSQALDQGDSFSFKFDKPGTFKYICSIHPKMKATITVK